MARTLSLLFIVVSLFRFDPSGSDRIGSARIGWNRDGAEWKGIGSETTQHNKTRQTATTGPARAHQRENAGLLISGPNFAPSRRNDRPPVGPFSWMAERINLLALCGHFKMHERALTKIRFAPSPSRLAVVSCDAKIRLEQPEPTRSVRGLADSRSTSLAAKIHSLSEAHASRLYPGARASHLFGCLAPSAPAFFVSPEHHIVARAHTGNQRRRRRGRQAKPKVHSSIFT